MRADFCAFLLLGMISMGLKGQVFNSEVANFQTDRLDFDERYIRTNGISYVKVRYQNKAPGKPLANLPDVDEYYFDEQGRMIQLKLVRTVDIRDIGKTADTTVILNRYNGNVLLSQTSRDRYGEYVQEWKCDVEGRYVAKNIYRNNVLISAETAEWTGNRCRWLNGEGRPYRDEWEEINSLGEVLSRYSLLLVVDHLSEIVYSYDQRGRITEVTERRPDGSRHRFKYFYSEPGELLQVQTRRNEVLRNEIEILYNEGLPEAFIIREPETNFMRIGKFEIKRNP